MIQDKKTSSAINCLNLLKIRSISQHIYVDPYLYKQMCEQYKFINTNVFVKSTIYLPNRKSEFDDNLRIIS